MAIDPNAKQLMVLIAAMVLMLLFIRMITAGDLKQEYYREHETLIRKYMQQDN